MGKLLNLMKSNPKLPVVPLVDGEIAGDDCGYWVATRENAIRPLYQLLAMAQMRPDGVWEGD